MAIDSKGNNHQPKGTPNAGRFAPKAGAGDDDDLHEDSFPGHVPPALHARQLARRRIRAAHEGRLRCGPVHAQ